MKVKDYHGHKFKDSVFVTPLNTMANIQLVEWFKLNSPEYLWIALIINSYGRTKGLLLMENIIKYIIFNFEKNPDFLKISEIFKLDKTLKESLFNNIKSIINNDCLDCMCLLYNCFEEPEFNNSFNSLGDYETRSKQLNEVLDKLNGHHTRLTLDVCYCILRYKFLTNYFMVDKNFEIYKLLNDNTYIFIKNIDDYNTVIGSAILNLLNHIETEFIKDFWKKIGELRECKLMIIEYKEEKISDSFATKIKNIQEYYSKYLENIEQQDNKALVLLGILNYSLKLFFEIKENNMEQTIMSKLAFRVILENYLNTRYLLLHEKTDNDIWKKYQIYGLGQIKFIKERDKEFNEKEFNQINYDYIELLVNENLSEDFINMDTRNFDTKQPREKFEEIGEKNLYNLYDYCSGYDHGLWGSIRESSLIKCVEPSHNMHNILDSQNDQKLKSITNDIYKIIEKHIKVIDGIYELPTTLRM